MAEKRPFLYWALFVALIATGVVIAGQAGLFSLLYGSDPTHLTYVVTGVFVLGCIWSGRLAWRLSTGDDPESVGIDAMLLRIGFGACVSIGLIGTAIGYYMLYDSLGAGAAVGQVLKTIPHAKLALVNTIFGGVCGFLLEVTHGFLRYGVARKLFESGAGDSDV